MIYRTQNTVGHMCPLCGHKLAHGDAVRQHLFEKHTKTRGEVLKGAVSSNDTAPSDPLRQPV